MSAPRKSRGAVRAYGKLEGRAPLTDVPSATHHGGALRGASLE
jgi:hypothetical protein